MFCQGEWSPAAQLLYGLVKDVYIMEPDSHEWQLVIDFGPPFGVKHVNAHICSLPKGDVHTKPVHSNLESASDAAQFPSQ